ncbi:hypothetical protein BKA93DRAFT_830066 [Sparassis latifolia]
MFSNNNSSLQIKAHLDADIVSINEIYYNEKAMQIYTNIKGNVVNMHILHILCPIIVMMNDLIKLKKEKHFY